MDVTTLAVDNPYKLIEHGHILSPTGVAVLLEVVLVIDAMGIMPKWLSLRIVFLGGMAALRDGFQGSFAENWTVGQVAKLINKGLHSTHCAYIAGASANLIIGSAVGLVGIYCLGCMLPARSSGKLGRFTQLSFEGKKSAKTKASGDAPTKAKWGLTVKVWILAAILGIFCDLVGGGLGLVLRYVIYIVSCVGAAILLPLFGA